MTLKIPVVSSPTALPGWVRQTADAVNGMGNKFTGLIARIVALETFAATPFTVASITLPAATLPASPVHGMLATDITDGKLKYYDGTTWQPLY